MSSIEQSAEKIIKEPIENLGYELYDVEYVKEGKDYFLRIYIENENGISLDDCEKVSNAITDLLDKEDIIKEQYFLEVSSTGIEKILKKDEHLSKNIGNKVQVKLFKPLEGKKSFEGILKDYDSNCLYIEDTNEIKLERKNIAQIKTIYEW